MWSQVLETAGGVVVRLTPNTPPAVWLPYIGYAATTIAALIIAATVLKISGSKLAAGAAAIAFVVTPTTVQSGFGPLVAVLMVFGAFFSPTRQMGAITVALALAGLIVVGAGHGIGWILAGCGLAIVADSAVAARGPKGPHLRLAVVVGLTLLMITARLPAATTSVPPAPKPMGHDRVTLKSMRALLSNIPTGSALVRDDRITDILFRAMTGDLERARVEIAHIDNNAAAIRETLKTKRVFALPHAQQALSMQGFEIVDGLRVTDRGLAQVRPGADCVVATHAWQEAPSLAGRTELAFVADNDDRRGPVVLLLSGQEGLIRVSPIGWAPRTLRGFSPRSFDLRSREGTRDFADATADDNLMIHSKTTGSFVTRVALWRMPDAPRLMKIELSLPAPLVSVYLSPEAKQPVSVCPVFPASAFPIR